MSMTIKFRAITIDHNTAAGIGLAQLDRIEEMLSKEKIFTKGISEIPNSLVLY